MTNKILLTCIFKDDSEYEMAERMLESFMPSVDGLVVALTGVSGQFDKLKALLDQYKADYVVTNPQTHPKIYLQREDGSYIFANFAEARNEVFRLADTKKGFDWYLWADIDDILIGGNELKLCAEAASKMNVDTVFMTYWYSVVLDEKGNIRDILIDHLRERLLKPGVFKWISRLHEVAVAVDSNYQPKHTLYDFNPSQQRQLTFAHLVDESRMKTNLERNIDILKVQIAEEHEKDPRTVFYLAKTYYDLKNPELDNEAEKLILEKYIPFSGWDEERSNAWEYVGNIRSRRGDHRGAIDAYHSAAKEFPDRHMIYLLMAKEYAELGLMPQSTFWMNTALAMPQPKTRTTIGNPLEIKLLAASLKYNESIRSNNLDEAIKWYKVRMEILGEKDTGMLETLQEAKLLNEAGMWIFNYAKWLNDHGYKSKIAALLDSVPIEFGREAFIHMISNDLKEPKDWKDNEITIFASFGGEHFEQWSGKSLSRGIGGSETAVIELARRWAKMGYKVTVYGDPREDEGLIDGVEYKPYYTFNWKDKFNILILWRSPHLVDRVQSAKKLYIDLHDIVSQLDYPEERMKKLDKVFFKSQAHRKMLPKLPDEKAVIISNGI